MRPTKTPPAAIATAHIIAPAANPYHRPSKVASINSLNDMDAF